jgi:hypothetical protein
MRRITSFLLSALVVVVIPWSASPWSNGPSGNATTNQAQECDNPPYSTHDWIADHALALLPDEEKAWLVPHRAMYLLGTEAPDNRHIPDECGAPNNGYDDRNLGHSVEWNEDHSEMVETRAARRAQEEYSKAIIAFEEGNPGAAAFYLGAMAHYVGDVSQYGHTYPDEVHHSDYEGWVGRRTEAFDDGTFESYIELGRLIRRRPYTAVKRISRVTSGGKGPILAAEEMDDMYEGNPKPQEFSDSVGESLNLGVNELADVLHTFYLNVVVEEDGGE